MESGAICEQLRAVLGKYRRTLQSDRRHLLGQFTLVQMARKVVGVGSVGTRAWVLLMDACDVVGAAVGGVSGHLWRGMSGLTAQHLEPTAHYRRFPGGELEQGRDFCRDGLTPDLYYPPRRDEALVNGFCVELGLTRPPAGIVTVRRRNTAQRTPFPDV